MPKKGETKSTAKPRSKQQRAYNSTAKAKKDRAARNKARAEAERDGRVTKGDGKDIDHKNPLRKSNRITPKHRIGLVLPRQVSVVSK